MSGGRSFNSLAIHGNLLEVPQPKIEVKITRPIDKKRITPLEISKKRSTSFSSKTNPSISNRSISELSNQDVSKKNSIVSLNSINENDLKKYQDEIKKLKKRNEELEAQLKSSQKMNKDKEKLIEDLTSKLNNSLNQENIYNQNRNELTTKLESLKQENDSLSKQLIINEDLKKLENAKAKEELNTLKMQQDIRIKKIEEEHLNEIRLREEKLENLKKQIAGAFKDNSWERQAQIDELTKELKRVQEESDLIKHKLKGYKNKFSDSCQNCNSMHDKLEEKTKLLREKELLVEDLVNLMRKFQNQLNFQDELIKIVNSSSKKNLNDSLTKLGINLKQQNSIRVKK